LLAEGLAKLLGGDEPLGDQQVTKAPHHLLTELHLSHGELLL
jgi:hypothetical protein